MNVVAKKLPRGRAEITVEMTVDEYQPFLQKAVVAVSQNFPLPGFRPGKAPYAVIAEKIGEAKIWEEALEPAVKKTFVAALKESGLLSVGAPHISVLTLAPGNPVSYRAVISLLPTVELADLTAIKVARQSLTVADADVTSTIDDIRKLRRTEVLVPRPARANDKVEIKLETRLENVPIEQGQNDRLPLVLGEKRLLPGFEEQLVGLAAGERKTFTLTMPVDYHNRMVAGKPVEFRVQVSGVFELTMPEANDAFAKNVGRCNSIFDLRAKVKDNLLSEAAKRENDRLENAILDELITKSKFSDIPDLLVTSETKNMIAELEAQIGNRGVSFDDYLTQLKKTRAQLLLDFAPQAVKRVKGALITRDIANKNQVNVSEQEVDEAMAQEFAVSGAEPEMKERMKTPEFHAQVRNILASRKVMEYLKQTVVNN